MCGIFVPEYRCSLKAQPVLEKAPSYCFSFIASAGGCVLLFPHGNAPLSVTTVLSPCGTVGAVAQERVQRHGCDHWGAHPCSAALRPRPPRSQRLLHVRLGLVPSPRTPEKALSIDLSTVLLQFVCSEGRNVCAHYRQAI